MAASAWAQPFMYRPGQEFRTVSAETYTLSVQKNGRVDLVLSNLVEVFSNARPMVWLEGDAVPRELDIQGKRSYRDAVKTVLGEGQGMILDGDDGQWVLHTYPSKPFFVAQIVYTNSGKKPVRVRSLHPWHVGGSIGGKIDLGPGSADTRVLTPWALDGGAASADEGRGAWVLAALNPSSGLSVIAGYLAYDGARSEFALERLNAGEEGAYDSFQAAYIFDEPVEVAPGGSVTSGPLYIAVGEPDPLRGMERLAVAMQRSTDGDAVWLPAVSPPAGVTLSGPGDAKKLISTADVSSVDDLEGAVRAVAEMSSRYFVSPWLGTPIAPTIVTGDASRLTPVEEKSLLTQLALLGAAIPVSGGDTTFLGAIAEGASKPAQPIDLFAEGVPRVYALPLESALDDVVVLGVFNWDGEAPEVTVPLASLGLIPNEYYAVYDIWQDRLVGTAQHSLPVSVARGSMALFALRLRAAQPVCLGVAGSITLGADQIESVQWDAPGRVLRGTLKANNAEDALRVLVPESYETKRAEIDGEPVPFRMDGGLLQVMIPSHATACTWRIHF